MKAAFLQGRLSKHSTSPLAAKNAGRAKAVNKVIAFIDSSHPRRFVDIKKDQLTKLDEIVDDDFMAHHDGMWLPAALHGKDSFREYIESWQDSIPDYQVDILSSATCEKTGNQFLFFRAEGTNKSPQFPSMPASGRKFVHYGLERQHFSSKGKLLDAWVYCGPTADQAEHLLLKPELPFDEGIWEPIPDLSAQQKIEMSTERRKMMRHNASYLLELLGCRPDLDIDVELPNLITDDFCFQEETRLWSHNNMQRMQGLDETKSRLKHMRERIHADLSYPIWLGEAFSEDGRQLFIHYENVMMSRRTRMRTVVNGMMLMLFADDGRISRIISCRGPATHAEKAAVFDVLCLKTCSS